MTVKRFVKFNITANDDCTIQNGVKDSVTGEWYHTVDNQNATKLCKLLNELHEENKELEYTIETICKDFEESHGMDIRNTDWFTAW